MKGLEFSRILTVPYETPNVRIVSEDPGSQDRIWIRCDTTGRSSNARTLLCQSKRCSASGLDDLVSDNSEHRERKRQTWESAKRVEKLEMPTAAKWDSDHVRMVSGIVVRSIFKIGTDL